jgi:hypothetical protein
MFKSRSYKTKAILKYNKIYYKTNDLTKELKTIKKFIDNPEYSFVKKVNNFEYKDESVNNVFINMMVDIEFSQKQLDEFASKLNEFMKSNYKLFYKNFEKTLRLTSTPSITSVVKMFDNFELEDKKEKDDDGSCGYGENTYDDDI